MFQFSANKTLCPGILLQNPLGGLPPQGVLASLSLFLCDAAESSLLHGPQPPERLLSSKPLSPSGLNLSQTWGLIHVFHCDDYEFPPSVKLHSSLEEGRTSSLAVSPIQTCITQRGKTRVPPVHPSGGPSLNSRVDTLTFVTLLIDSLVHSRGVGCYCS